MKRSIFAAAGLAACAFAVPAVAAPVAPAHTSVDAGSMTTHVQGYHRSCGWTGSGWGYKHRGKFVSCRPNRPRGNGWYWHSEGGKNGWYHRQRKSWHHKW